jgi:hypothetical protein
MIRVKDGTFQHLILDHGEKVYESSSNCIKLGTKPHCSPAIQHRNVCFQRVAKNQLSENDRSLDRYLNDLLNEYLGKSSATHLGKSALKVLFRRFFHGKIWTSSLNGGKLDPKPDPDSW